METDNRGQENNRKKTNKTKTSFFEKIHIIDKASIRLTKEKRGSK